MWLTVGQVINQHGEAITPAALESMKYLEVVIKESMRMRPIAAGAFRRASKTFVLQGYTIEKVISTSLPSQ
jgi:cytochrome P450